MSPSSQLALSTPRSAERCLFTLAGESASDMSDLKPAVCSRRSSHHGPEGHAAAVADAVSRGGSATGLLGERGRPVGAGEHAYTLFSEQTTKKTNQWNIGKWVRVGDQGRTLTSYAASLGDQKECYAEPGLIQEAAKILETKRSGLKITAGPETVTGDAPNKSGTKTLNRVSVQIRSATDPTQQTTIWSDCGRAAREVMGPTNTDTAPHARFRDADGRDTESSPSKDPNRYRDELYVKAGLGATPTEGRAAYLALEPAERAAFDAKHGINQHASPAVGDAVVAIRDDGSTDEGFNWHWGGVIVTAGPDHVTFENYHKRGDTYASKDAKWYFNTYGPPSTDEKNADQTFFDQWETGVGEENRNTTIMVARTSGDPAPILAQARTLESAELLRRLANARDDLERRAYQTELCSRAIVVTVTVNTTEDTFGPDSVYVLALHAGQRVETEPVDLDAGQSHTFRLPLSDLTRFDGDFKIAVWDQDSPDPDDLVEWIAWSGRLRHEYRDPQGYTVDVRFER